MKKATRNLFLGFAVILLIAIITASYYFVNDSDHGLTAIGPKMDVLVIDKADQTPEQLLQNFEAGHSELLVWIDRNNEGKQAYVFNTLESLIRLEKTTLGFLDSGEPELKGLNVARYDAAKNTLYYKSIKKAHIQMIEINRNYLIGEVLADPKNYKNQAGIVVFSDGTKKELRMIKVSEKQVQEAKLVLDKNNTGNLS